MNGCQYSSSYPLYSREGNSLDPCFIYDVGCLLYCLFGAFIGFEIFKILYLHGNGVLTHGYLADDHSTRTIRYSFGSYFSTTGQKFRLSLIVVYGLLVNIVIFKIKGTWAIVTSVVLLLAFILHLIEITRTVVQSTSLLWFWLTSVVYNSLCLIQELFSADVQIWEQSSIKLKFLVWSISGSIFILEVHFWQPTIELVEYFDLNDWDRTSIHNSFTNITFSWVQDLLTSVYKTDVIDMKMIPKTPADLKIKFTLEKFIEQWRSEIMRARKREGHNEIDENDVSLLTSILKSYWPLILFSFILEASSTILTFAEPFLQQQFILFFANSLKKGEDIERPPRIYGYFIASLFFLISMLRTVLNTQSSQLKAKATFSSTSISSLIYRKSLRLSTESRQTKNVGQIMNHLSLDIPVIRSFPTGSAVKIIIAPFKVVLCVLALHKIIGNAVWGGVAAALIMIPLVSKIKGITTPLTKKIMEYKDARLQLLNEVVNSMLSVKLYTWEDSIENRIKDIRNGKELKTIKQLSVWNAFSRFIFSTVPFFILSSSILAFVMLYKDVPLSPEIIFPALSLFNVLGKFISSTSGLIQKFAKAKVSFNRVEEFLLLEEKEDDEAYLSRSYGYIEDGSQVIRVTNGTFLWLQSDKEHIALKNINLEIKKGHLICLVGKVGSGKSTLIKGILGEIPLLEGTSFAHGTIAYCSQNAWIINASVKDNILFGFKYDKSNYDRTIRVCELLVDIDSFPNGDQTLVGEKGISLSGGQKARISLARAIYSNSDIYILDDILSAVDRFVGAKLIQNVLGEQGILKDKTRILATNYIPMIHLADEIVLVEGGSIVERGLKGEAVKSKEIDRLIKEYGGNSEVNSVQPSIVDVDLTEREELQEMSELGEIQDSQELQVRDAQDVQESPVVEGSNLVQEDSKILKIDDIALANENSSSGKVKSSVFYDYFRACNYMTIFIYAGLTVASTSVTVYQTTILSRWSNLNLKFGKTIDPAYYLSLYALLVIMRGAFTMTALIIVWVFSFIEGSTYFHDKMVSNILQSPMQLFETTPVGTILNRFSNDVSAMDLTIPGIFVGAVNLIINSLTSFAIIIWHLPMMILVILFLLGIYDSIRRYFIPASREFKRLSRTANSPILSHLSESINGIETLNAYGQIERYVELNDQKLESYISINYTNSSLSRWLTIRLQTISSTILFSTCVFCLLSLDKGDSPFDAALVGFILNYALSIPGQLRSIITTWTQVETQTVAIERIIDYCKLPLEAPRRMEIDEKIIGWPSKGALKFVNYSTRYRENLPMVLKGINVEIGGKEKIGIIGRTGSGKSTITRAIYRLLEETGGHIEIDEIITKDLGLHKLRHNLSIIPQNCQTIEGTVRENLDPFNEHSDEELWKVLEMSYLKDHIMKLKGGKPKMKKKQKNRKQGSEATENLVQVEDQEPVEGVEESESENVGLNSYIYQGGSNLSVGQKQLLCLARAILNPSTILILDEATAAVDMDTDLKVQSTIREYLKERTILTIAHRLETIMDSDKIIVLDNGEIIEFGTPEELMQNGGLLTELVNH
ncbi:bile pigment transporter 1 [[Candida] railenensis]|uniref:Bile pigment transporter 1 n=1 Tax=[Candida] railenensis TaxID=45579 RepID=A0A9P0QUN0_9ASCO|nr:bile pigment transporter 1 [[Candida] railenensis]